MLVFRRGSEQEAWVGRLLGILRRCEDNVHDDEKTDEKGIGVERGKEIK